MFFTGEEVDKRKIRTSIPVLYNSFDEVEAFPHHADDCWFQLNAKRR